MAESLSLTGEREVEEVVARKPLGIRQIALGVFLGNLATTVVVAVLYAIIQSARN